MPPPAGHAPGLPRPPPLRVPPPPPLLRRPAPPARAVAHGVRPSAVSLPRRPRPPVRPHDSQVALSQNDLAAVPPAGAGLHAAPRVHKRRGRRRPGQRRRPAPQPAREQLRRRIHGHVADLAGLLRVPGPGRRQGRPRRRGRGRRRRPNALRHLQHRERLAASASALARGAARVLPARALPQHPPHRQRHLPRLPRALTLQGETPAAPPAPAAATPATAAPASAAPTVTAAPVPAAADADPDADAAAVHGASALPVAAPRVPAPEQRHVAPHRGHDYPPLPSRGADVRAAHHADAGKARPRRRGAASSDHPRW